jgi:hypothetical protein
MSLLTAKVSWDYSRDIMQFIVLSLKAKKALCLQNNFPGNIKLLRYFTV